MEKCLDFLSFSNSSLPNSLSSSVTATELLPSSFADPEGVSNKSFISSVLPSEMEAVLWQ